MRKLIAAFMAAGVAAVAAPALAADLPYYPPVIDVPPVDYGLGGSLYLRGSGGMNWLWAQEAVHPAITRNPIDQLGFGYSLGAGVGYETGTGLRFDATVDYLSNEGMQATIPAGNPGGLASGPHKLSLRSTIVLANAYYDFGLGDNFGYGAAGGMFGYVGAGAGVAFNRAITTGPGAPDTWGGNTSFAAAGMVGVGYDFGQVVADVGYRALYINQIANPTAAYPYEINHNWAHEVRGTVRYRFN